MRSLGATELSAWLGPCVHPECYEFGADDLDRLVDRFGPAVRSKTTSGADAFDLPMAVAGALGRAGIALAGSADACTACDGRRFYSFRARRDEGRHALAVWIDA
jgi:copper oxidase (laccase) domain-containing protein